MPRKSNAIDMDKEIPGGLYCYRIIGSRRWNNIQIPRTKNCPYYRYKEDIDGYCDFMDEEIEDQCKICGINWESEEGEK